MGYSVSNLGILAFFLSICLPALRASFSFKYLRYVASEEEQQWLKNVDVWQLDVCSYLLKDPKYVHDYIKDIYTINEMSDKDMIEYILAFNSKTPSRFISHHVYEVTKNISAEASIQFEIGIPIEGIIGLARDPRVCLDDKYTQSKAYLLPLHKTIFQYMNKDADDNLSAAHKAKEFFFDAGATYFTDPYMPGIAWVIEWYLSHNYKLHHIISWEQRPLMGNLVLEGIPESLIPGWQYFNHGIRSDDSVWNPLNFILKKTSTRDYVAFKLDVDHIELETTIVNQLIARKNVQDHIDDFYYEEHFNNTAMLKWEWGKYQTSLADYYHKTVMPLRQTGFRIHYWP
jgi:hypothetical protein